MSVAGTTAVTELWAKVKEALSGKLATSGGTLTGDLDLDGADLTYDSETAYPTFIRSSWSTGSDESTLPVTPCFVLSTSDNVMYWCSGSGIKSMHEALWAAWDTKETGIDQDSSTPPSGYTWPRYRRLVRALDKDGDVVGFVEANQQADGRVGLSFTATRIVNGQPVYNGITPYVAADGTLTYSVTNKANFCNAIEAVKRGGDTMTGALIIKSSNVNRDGAIPTDSDRWFSAYGLRDTDNENIGNFTGVLRKTTGTIEVGMYAYNENSSGQEVNNYIRCAVDRSGNQSYMIGSPAAFRSTLGLDGILKVVSGTSASITLAAGATNTGSVVDLSPGSGWTLLGVRSVHASNKAVSATNFWRRSNTQFGVSTHNQSSSSKTFTITVEALYVNSNFV